VNGDLYPSGRANQLDHRQESTNLADILERVLDKGIVIAGDIQVNLLDIELLTIKIRLLVASVDKAREMGIDWWEHDPSLSSGGGDLAVENRRLRDRIGELEASNGDKSGSPQKGRSRRPTRRTEIVDADE
jgi:Gas vesicle protein